MVEQASKYRYLFLDLAKNFGFPEPVTNLERILEEQRQNFSELLLPELVDHYFPNLRGQLNDAQQRPDPV